MSTIERLAELAKGATQGEWGSCDHGHRVAEIVVYAKDTFFAICCFEGNYAFVENDIAQHKADADYIAECNPAAIAQAATEYKALLAENERLREALTGMVAQHGCDCGHPHCNRCAETRECKAALAQGEVGNDN